VASSSASSCGVSVTSSTPPINSVVTSG
jgi:hypothetical protein